nr:hypothetical protein A4A49_15699 [Ipomoea trifida]GMD43644.1 S-protein homolog 29 [Ipomoea batatas]
MVAKHNMILVLALVLTLSTSSSSSAAKLPKVEIANEYSKTIRVNCKEIGMVDLSPGKIFAFEAELIEGDPIHCFCICENIYADVVPYDPEREKDPVKIYWKANKGGFYISYDKTHWKFVLCNAKNNLPGYCVV